MEPLIFNWEDPHLWEKIRFKNPEKAVFITPTDTVYGLGTLFSNREGIERILKLKQRRDPNFIILARDIEEILQMAELSTVQEIIVKRYWPGPISFILRSRKYSSATLALRIPKNPFLENLMNTVGGPLLSTSCNFHGNETVAQVSQAVELFSDQVDFYVDGGAQQNSVASTLVDLTSPKPTVVREGAVSFP